MSFHLAHQPKAHSEALVPSCCPPLACAIGVIICIASFFVPESPRWLATAGLAQDARDAFVVIARFNGSTAPKKMGGPERQASVVKAKQEVDAGTTETVQAAEE